MISPLEAIPIIEIPKAFLLILILTLTLMLIRKRSCIATIIVPL